MMIRAYGFSRTSGGAGTNSGSLIEFLCFTQNAATRSNPMLSYTWMARSLSCITDRST